MLLSMMLNENIKDYRDYILEYYNDEKYPFSSGLDIQARRVYSICPGKVITATNAGAFKYSVTVMINNKQIVRYTNLKSINVKEGSEVDFHTFIGVADRFVRFEYCTAEQGTSKWPVRIKSLTMYKQDPLGLLIGTIKLDIIVDNVHRAKGDEPLIPLDRHTLAEFTGSRGDE